MYQLQTYKIIMIIEQVAWKPNQSGFKFIYQLASRRGWPLPGDGRDFRDTALSPARSRALSAVAILSYQGNHYVQVKPKVCHMPALNKLLVSPSIRELITTIGMDFSLLTFYFYWKRFESDISCLLAVSIQVIFTSFSSYILNICNLQINRSLAFP